MQRTDDGEQHLRDLGQTQSAGHVHCHSTGLAGAKHSSLAFTENLLRCSREVSWQEVVTKEVHTQTVLPYA